MVDFYDVSPPDPRDCEIECIYDVDADTLADRKYHRRVDEGEMR